MELRWDLMAVSLHIMTIYFVVITYDEAFSDKEPFTTSSLSQS